MRNITLYVTRVCPSRLQLIHYVEAKGWRYRQTIYRFDGMAIWDEYTNGDNEIRIIFSEEFSDYEFHCSEAIKEIADSEQRDTFDVYNDIAAIKFEVQS